MGVWVGFDAKVTLGDKETGGKAALPIWFDAMQQITKGKPPEPFDPRETPVISGVVSGVALHVNQEPKGAQQ
jgi:penicillin-binding protein 1A